VCLLRSVFFSLFWDYSEINGPQFNVLYVTYLFVSCSLNLSRCAKYFRHRSNVGTQGPERPHCSSSPTNGPELRSQVLMAVSIDVIVLWDVVPCNVREINKRF
jgi:hypothetical protein